jgi:hypothetical protein
MDKPEVINIVPSMGGITTALVVFIFACLLYPKTIKNRTQFYAGFACVLLILLLNSLDVMIRQAGFQVFSGAVTGLLQLFGLIMFFLSAGGMSAGELADELKRSYEVMRRGDDTKTVIVPLTGEMPRRRDDQVPGGRVELTAAEAERVERGSLPLEDEPRRNDE